MLGPGPGRPVERRPGSGRSGSADRRPLSLRASSAATTVPSSIARLLAVFLSESGSGSCFVAPGSPWQNGFAESFHSTLRRDHLDVEAFANLADAQVKTALYRRYYNEERPHSSLRYVPPARYAKLSLNPGGLNLNRLNQEGLTRNMLRILPVFGRVHRESVCSVGCDQLEQVAGTYQRIGRER